MTAIATFFASRSDPPAKFRCGCCGDILDREDHMGDSFADEHTEAVVAKFGPEVCFGCADQLGKDWT